MPDPTLSPSVDPYRHGYREGFHDGFAAQKNAAGGDSKPSDAKQRQDDKDGQGPKDGKSEDKDKDKDKEGDGKPLYRRPVLVALVLLLVLGAIVAGIVYWRHAQQHESTDDAFIDGRASSIASQTNGRVLRLLVEDNQQVHAGDLLLEIDPRDNEARAAQARAQLADAESQRTTAQAQVQVRRAAELQAAASTRQAQAQLTKAEQDLARFRAVDPDAVPRQQADAAAAAAASARAQLDEARSAERSARAQTAAAAAQVTTSEASIEAARASVSAAELQLGYTRVVAPVDGRVTRRSIEVGNVVSAGQPLLSIVGDALWVTANYKETQLTRLRRGMAVEVTVDAFPDTKLRAHIDSIQRGTGSYFSMLPAENATGNFVKVVQRVPVKIVFDDPSQVQQLAIGPGMSVTPDVTIP